MTTMVSDISGFHLCQSYASILYLRLPPNFRIILRGEDVQHHNIVSDMMLAKEITYKPLHLQKDSNVMLFLRFIHVLDLA
jgi:N6-adenosine-specific RNA methylase IME4